VKLQPPVPPPRPARPPGRGHPVPGHKLPSRARRRTRSATDAVVAASWPG